MIYLEAFGVLVGSVTLMSVVLFLIGKIVFWFMQLENTPFKNAVRLYLPLITLIFMTTGLFIMIVEILKGKW